MRARVVSLPSWYLFDRQPEEYRESVLPAAVDGAGRGRAGIDARLGPLRRPARSDGRHAHLRRLGAAEGGAERSSASRPSGWSKRADEVLSGNARRRHEADAALHELGQSLWLDNITRTMLDDGTLQRYIDELSITGLTSNPTIFDKAISAGDAYDEQIAELQRAGLEGEELFFELALTDLRQAAELFEPINEPHRRRRRLGLARGLAAARRRRRGDDRAGARPALPRRRATSSSRSPAPRPG